MTTRGIQPPQPTWRCPVTRLVSALLPLTQVHRTLVSSPGLPGQRSSSGATCDRWRACTNTLVWIALSIEFVKKNKIDGNQAQDQSVTKWSWTKPWSDAASCRSAGAPPADLRLPGDRSPAPGTRIKRPGIRKTVTGALNVRAKTWAMIARAREPKKLAITGPVSDRNRR